MFRPISIWTLHKNEFLDVNQTEADNPPYAPQIYDECIYHESNDRINSQSTDEEFEWLEPTGMEDQTYFNIINKNRKTIQPGE